MDQNKVFYVQVNFFTGTERSMISVGHDKLMKTLDTVNMLMDKSDTVCVYYYEVVKQLNGGADLVRHDILRCTQEELAQFILDSL